MSSRSAMLVASLLVAMAALVPSAQQAPPSAPALPQLPPSSGSLTIRPETEKALAAVKAPSGFTVTAFAGPPIANYPACVTATHDGIVFVCVDRNGSLQTDANMGYIARLVDKDGNGQADAYTVFATLDSPRGAVFDGEALYVSHPPFVTALRDTNGDGIADDRRTLVRGLGYALDFRGADHTTNGLEMGIDGWLYVAVGDYGVVKATGADGREIQMRGGGNVRVRPDGSDLEIYSRGTRNDYDLAIDPYLNLFARGNTNDGGGFDIRMYHFAAGSTFGYPALFRNFSDEVVPPIADYGTGSGTGMLFVHDASLPAPYGDALYSVDWGRNAVFRHALTPKGSTFSVTQDEFVSVPRPTDMAIDGRSHLYVASWDGGQFRYAGENVGYLARLTHVGAKAQPPVDLTGASDARLVELIGSANLVTSRAAQAALLRNGRSTERSTLLERAASSGPLYARVAAIFTLKQLAGADATPSLVKMAADAAIRPFVLRAIADRGSELAGVPKALFVRALTDQDPRVVLESITGLRRMGATDAAGAMLPLTASKDPVIANVATNALVSLGAIDVPLATLKSASDDLAGGALRVLQQIHQPAVVSGLIATLSETKTMARRGAILQALARLHNREGIWRGTLAEWWGTRPDTTGPYYDPVAWEESSRIRGVLTNALLELTSGATAQDETFKRLATDLQRNRVLPPGGADLLIALAGDRHAMLTDAARLLVGRVRLEIDEPTGQALERIARVNSRCRAAVVAMAVAGGPPTAAAARILQASATDASLAAELRASVFTALASVPGPDAMRRSADVFASLVAAELDPPLEAVWRQFIATPSHAEHIALWRELAGTGDPSRQRLVYAVLLRIAADPPAAARGGRGGRGGGGGRGRGGPDPAVLEAARTEARAIIDAAWKGDSAAHLVWATGRTGAVRYRDRVTEAASASSAAVREAAAYAVAKLNEIAPAAAAAAPAPSGPTVSSASYEDVIERVPTLTGDAAVGRRLFTQHGCTACHTTAPDEPEKGPYLGGIFSRYSKVEVIESILRPAARVAQGFATHSFVTNDKRQITGFVVREGQDEVVVRDLAGTETRLRKNEIATRSVSEGSVMPPGLVDALTLQDLASMLAFLESTTAK